MPGPNFNTNTNNNGDDVALDIISDTLVINERVLRAYPGTMQERLNAYAIDNPQLKLSEVGELQISVVQDDNSRGRIFLYPRFEDDTPFEGSFTIKNPPKNTSSTFTNPNGVNITALTGDYFVTLPNEDYEIVQGDSFTIAEGANPQHNIIIKITK